MRSSLVLVLAALLIPTTSRVADACGVENFGCRAVVVVPVIVAPYPAPEIVDVPLPPSPWLERSGVTGQPLPVIYNGPSRYSGAVDPGLVLVPYPRAGRVDTQGAYPTGY